MAFKYNLQYLITIIFYSLTLGSFTQTVTAQTNKQTIRHEKNNSLIATLEKWPYMITIEHLLNDTHREICGGVLVHTQYVLTSNTCLDKRNIYNDSQAEASQLLRNNFELGQYFAVASGEVTNRKRKRIYSKRTVFAMRLINLWLPYSEFRMNLTTSEVNADVAIAVTEFDFPINLQIKPRMLHLKKQYAQKMTTEFMSCNLIHWPQRIINMTDKDSYLPLMVSPGEVVDWNLCETSTFIDEWSHICVQFDINDVVMTASHTLKSSGGPLVCKNYIMATMSPNAHVFRNLEDNRLNIVFNKVDDFYSFVLAITNEADILSAEQNSCSKVICNWILKVSIKFLLPLLILYKNYEM